MSRTASNTCLILTIILWAILIFVAARGIINDPPAGNPDGIDVRDEIVEEW